MLHLSLIVAPDADFAICVGLSVWGYRRPKSMRDLLERAKLKPDMRDDEPLVETRPCGKARCKTCKMITPRQIAKSASGATTKLMCNTSCKTMLSTLQHTPSVENNMLVKPVIMWTEHFCSPEHDFPNHATLCCLDHNPELTDRTKKARERERESYWIRRLNTLRPYRINKGDQ